MRQRILEKKPVEYEKFPANIREMIEAGQLLNPLADFPPSQLPFDPSSSVITPFAVSAGIRRHPLMNSTLKAEVRPRLQLSFGDESHAGSDWAEWIGLDFEGRLAYPSLGIPWSLNKKRTREDLLRVYFDKFRRLYYSTQGPRTIRVQDHEGGLFEFLPPPVRLAVVQKLDWPTIVNLAVTSREFLYGVFGGPVVLQQLRMLEWREEIKMEFCTLQQNVDTAIRERPFELFERDAVMEAALYHLCYNQTYQSPYCKLNVSYRSVSRDFGVSQPSIWRQIDDIWVTETEERFDYCRQGMEGLLRSKTDSGHVWWICKFVTGYDTLVWE